MKQVIVLTAILPIMMIFLVQFGLEQKNSLIVSVLQQEVYTAKEEAKQEGCFTHDIISSLKTNIGNKLGIDQDHVLVVATEEVQYRINYFDDKKERGLIHYSVSVPLDKIVAGGKILGIDPSKNRAIYTVEGMTASEKLP